MKEQNPDIPFVVQISGGFNKGIVYLPDEEAVDALILDPRGALLCKSGAYYYESKAKVCNAARSLRDKIRSNRGGKPHLELVFTTFNNNMSGEVELGNAVEFMVAEIKTLQKKYEKGYPEATSSG